MTQQQLGEQLCQTSHMACEFASHITTSSQFPSSTKKLTGNKQVSFMESVLLLSVLCNYWKEKILKELLEVGSYFFLPLLTLGLYSLPLAPKQKKSETGLVLLLGFFFVHAFCIHSFGLTLQMGRAAPGHVYCQGHMTAVYL